MEEPEVSIDEAILLHGGEANQIRNNYQMLTADEKTTHSISRKFIAMNRRSLLLNCITCVSGGLIPFL